VGGEDTHIAGTAGRYALALFDLAREQGELVQTAEALAALRMLLDESAELRQFTRSPIFSAEDQARAVSAIAAKAEFPALTTKFLLLLVRNRRLFVLSDIIAGFQSLYTASRDELRAEVTSAIPLNDGLVEELLASLKAKTGKDVLLNQKVDQAILGGLVVKIGSRMIDSSIRTKLNNLKIAMKEVG
jgi:F-type H+-transporting ATPase subunit delta